MQQRFVCKSIQKCLEMNPQEIIIENEIRSLEGSRGEGVNQFATNT